MREGDRVVVFTMPDGIKQTGKFGGQSKSDPDYGIVLTDSEYGSQLYHMAFIAPDTEANRKEIKSTCKEVKRHQDEASRLMITIRQRLAL